MIGEKERAGPQCRATPLALAAVGDHMTQRVVTVHTDDRLGAIKEIFDQVRFRHLLVIEDSGRLCGVISDRDLLRAVSPFIGKLSEASRDTATLNRRAHQIMSRHPLTLNAEAPLCEAIALFQAHRISCLPIVDAASKPVGILSLHDLAKVLASVLDCER